MSEAPRFRPPPGWPSPPPGWTPSAGWQPPTDWPPAPEGWQFWEPSDPAPEAAVGPDEQSVHTVAQPGRSQRYQRKWLAAFWSAASLNILFVVLAVSGARVPLEAVLSTMSGAVAAIAGSFLASAAYRRGIDDIEFDELAKGMRVAVVAWLILVTALVGGAVLGTGFGERSTAGPEVVDAITNFSEGLTAQLFGLGVLFVVVGDGYTAYRRLRVAPTTAA